MADKRDWNAQLNAKGLEASVSEDQAREMCNHQGATYLFIVEATAGPKVVNVDGSQKINLIPGSVELVPDAHADTARRFMRALYIGRPDQFGQAAFDGATADEPTIDDTASALASAVTTDDDGEVTGMWTPDTPQEATDGPWPGDADYVAPDLSGNGAAAQGDDTSPAGGNVVAFSAP